MTIDPVNGTDDPGGTATSSTDKKPTTLTSMDTMVTTSGRPMVTTDRYPAASSKTVCFVNKTNICVYLLWVIVLHLILENRLIFWNLRHLRCYWRDVVVAGLRCLTSTSDSSVLHDFSALNFLQSTECMFSLFDLQVCLCYTQKLEILK